ncbi:hypothetical protein L9F63_025353, partial [Diploptera punctata]
QMDFLYPSKLNSMKLSTFSNPIIKIYICFITNVRIQITFSIINKSNCSFKLSK